MMGLVAKILKIGIVLLVLAGCGQSINEVNFTAKNPNDDEEIIDPFIPLNYITNVDQQGGSSSTAVSPNHALSIQSFGGNSLRTYSTSPSFRMTSGIGVD